MNPAFISLMAFKIQQLAWQREPPGSFDHTWWQDQGWLEPACTFYFLPHSRRVKAALARLSGAIVYRFVV